MSTPDVFILRWFIHFLHYSGFFSLPGFYREPWKNHLHRWYSLAVVSLVQLYAVSIVSALFFFAIRDSSEFCERFFETLICVTCALDVLHIRWNLGRFLELLRVFEDFSRPHGRRPALLQLRRLEWRVMRVAWIVLALENSMNSYLIPRLPKSPDTLDRLRRIYHLRHPQNTFIIPMLIPWVDTSEPSTYHLLLLFLSYVFFLYTSTFVVAVMFYPVLVFEMKAYTEVLCDFVRLIGHEHRDERDNRIFYTNLYTKSFITRASTLSEALKNNYMDGNHAQCSDSHTYMGESHTFLSKNHAQMNHYNHINDNYHQIRSESGLTEEEKAAMYVFEKKPEAYEYFYLSQVVLLQKKLLLLREKLDSFHLRAFKVRGTSATIMIVVSMYGLLTPHLLSPMIRLKAAGEILILLCGYYGHVYCGEMLADVNPSIRRAAWQSLWYRTAARTRRGLLMMLRVTQRICYVSIFDLLLLNNSLMIKTFRVSYSFFNFMNLSRER